MSDRTQAALALAATGTAVFPCNADKSPRTPRGFHDATTDADTIRGWDWNGDGMIGAALAPGWIVVDVDPRNGGDKTMMALPALPKTRTVRTGGGGYHYYLTAPAELELRGTLGPGVDIKRAGKGYVIVPPSAGYETTAPVPVVPAPAWLLDELRVERSASSGVASDPKYFVFEKGTAYGLRALDGEIGRMAMAREGGRNAALNTAAFALAQLVAGGELDEEYAREEIEFLAEKMGLPLVEISKTINSGWNAGLQEPRQAPVVSSDEQFPGTGNNAPEATDPEAEARMWVDWNVDEAPPPFYCHPILPRNAYVLIYGATEASKSMATVGLLCQGSHHGIRTSVYSLENPPHTDRDRLRRWCPDPANFRLTNESLDFNDARQVEALVAREKAWGTDVVLIDTYSHAFNSRSEDGNAKAIEFARRVRYVMAQVGCSVVVIDHTGFQGDEPRDASAKRQQVDCAILMEKEGEWAKGQPARFKMTNRKAARFANPFFLRGEIQDTDARGLRLAFTFASDEPRWEAA